MIAERLHGDSLRMRQLPEPRAAGQADEQRRRDRNPPGAAVQLVLVADAASVGDADAGSVRHGLCQQLFAQAGWDWDSLHHGLDALVGGAALFKLYPTHRALLQMLARGDQVRIDKLLRERVEPHGIESFKSGFTSQRFGLR